jgi:hypothetical protein
MASFRIAVQLALMKGLTMHDIITINMHYCKSTIMALEEMSDDEKQDSPRVVRREKQERPSPQERVRSDRVFTLLNKNKRRASPEKQ